MNTIRVAYGDMWDHFDEADLFLVTTNSCLTTDGKLVMGAGIAKTLRDRAPGIDKRMGARIKEAGKERRVYGVMIEELQDGSYVGIFQTKIDFKDDSQMPVIRYSARSLLAIIRGSGMRNVYLNFPGIGYGGLDMYKVAKELIPILPEEVTLWIK